MSSTVRLSSLEITANFAQPFMLLNSASTSAMTCSRCDFWRFSSFGVEEHVVKPPPPPLTDHRVLDFETLCDLLLAPRLREILGYRECTAPSHCSSVVSRHVRECGPQPAPRHTPTSPPARRASRYRRARRSRLRNDVQPSVSLSEHATRGLRSPNTCFMSLAGGHPLEAWARAPDGAAVTRQVKHHRAWHDSHPHGTRVCDPAAPFRPAPGCRAPLVRFRSSVPEHFRTLQASDIVPGVALIPKAMAALKNNMSASLPACGETLQPGAPRLGLAAALPCEHVATMTEPTPEHFAQMYEGTPPWDIGRPQQAFVRLAEQGALQGEVLDAGCGTGENALHLASLGCAVVGVDAVPAAIERARAKMRQRGYQLQFLVADALQLDRLGRRFDSVIDSGLFHVFSDADRVRYVASLASAVRDGGRVFILSFSEREPGDWGPRRVTERELRDSFRAGWQVERIVPERLETNLGPKGVEGWLFIVRRVATQGT